MRDVRLSDCGRPMARRFAGKSRPRRTKAPPASATVTLARGIRWVFEAPEPARNSERTKICPDNFEIKKVDHIGRLISLEKWKEM